MILLFLRQWYQVARLHQVSFRLDVSKNFFTGRMVKNWNRPKKVVNSLFLEVSKKCGFVTKAHGLMMGLHWSG